MQTVCIRQGQLNEPSSCRFEIYAVGLKVLLKNGRQKCGGGKFRREAPIFPLSLQRVVKEIPSK